MMALARQTDPATSHAAAADHEASGKAASNRAKCLACVREHPEGLTAPEIAAATGLTRHEPSRRLPELEQMGLVVKGPARRCMCRLPDCGGKSMVTWLLPPPKQRELFE